MIVHGYEKVSSVDGHAPEVYCPFCHTDVMEVPYGRVLIVVPLISYIYPTLIPVRKDLLLLLMDCSSSFLKVTVSVRTVL